MHLPKSVSVLIGLIAAAPEADAASLRLHDLKTGKHVTGDTVSIAWENNGYKGVISLDKHVSLFNGSDKEISVLAKKIEYDPLQKDVDHVFCFAGLCYSEQVYVSPFTEILPPGKSDSGWATGFKGSYIFDNTSHAPGVDRVAYVFFDENNPDDSSVVFVKYSTLAISAHALTPAGKRFPPMVRYDAALGSILFRFDDRAAAGASGPLILRLTTLAGEKIGLSRMAPVNGGLSFRSGKLHPGVYGYSAFAGWRLLSSGELTVAE
jgi:hypothetical protein